MDRFSVLVLGCIFSIILFISLAVSVQQSDPLKQFNVTPDSIFLNWTNNYASNITITINETFNNITIEILNSTSGNENYTQSNLETACTNHTTSGYKLYVINSYGNYTNTIGPLNATNSTNVIIIDNLIYNHLVCKPGRYWVEKFTIRNSTQTNETVNITIFIDIPISSSNPNNANILTTGIGSFYGRLPINATTYHSFYFNSSLVPNATGIKINLTLSSSQDADLFLFDNSSTPVLKAKSINTTTTESLLYSYVPQNMMWEIRVYGNSTSEMSYNGNIIFTTLNVTNSSNSSQQVSSMNFGNMNASETKQINITLKNEGNLILSNVAESKELYFIKMFGGSGPNNFTLLVPNSSITSKVKASLNWTGSSNYSLRIYNQSDSLLVTSANKHFNANKTGVMQEEYNETTNIGSTAGLWKFEIFNSSANDADPYNITVYIYVSPSNWTVTNYTLMTINRTGNNNYAVDVQVNFTVQNISLDGSYEGYVQYLDNNGAGIKVPLSLNVRTPMLVVNNSLGSMTSTINENYGVNHTRSVNFLLNNTGYYNLSLTLTNSSGILTCFSGSCSGYFANLNYNQTTSINNYSSQVLNVNITYNTSMPVGIYEGWLFMNGSNYPTSSGSHPYETFNLTLRLNLTRDLDVRNFDIISIDGDKIVGNASVDENVTAKFKIYYTNGTEIEAGTALNTSNFTIWLTHKNMSSFRIPSTSGSLTLYNGTNPIYIDSTRTYSVNFNVPQNKPGGTYDVHAVANYTKSASAIYGGEAVNQTLIINNSAIYLSFMNSTPIYLDEITTSYYYVTATNYGTKPAMGSITFSNSTCQYAIFESTASSGMTNCSGTVSGGTWKEINVPNGTTCYFAWKITTYNVSTDRSCGPDVLKITYNESNLQNVTISNLYVYDDDGGGTTTTTVSSSENEGGVQDTTTITTTTTTTIPTVKYLNITSYPSVVSIAQGSNKTENVTVNNINNTLTQTVNLTVLFINSTWYSIYPSSGVTIANKTSYTYNITFMIPDNTTVKDYSGKFFAESSYGGVTQAFTLRVTPGTKLQSQISANLSSYKIEIQNIEKELNKTKNQNNTEAKNLFSQLKQKFSQASSYANQSDYRSAYDLLDDIESLLNQTKTALSLSGSKGFGLGINLGDLKGLSIWIIIAVVAIVAVVLGYLFWPTSGGFKPQKEYLPEVKKDDKKTTINEQLEKLKEKWRRAQESKK
jgi:hypothetical protein